MVNPLHLGARACKCGLNDFNVSESAIASLPSATCYKMNMIKAWGVNRLNPMVTQRKGKRPNTADGAVACIGR
jgi:hypothetical protein